MNKKYLKIIIISVLALLLIIVVGVLFVMNNKATDNKLFKLKANLNMVEIMSENEKVSLNLYHAGVYGVISRDKNGNITSYKFIKLQEEKPLQLELMSNADKIKLGLSIDEKIQILQKDVQGNIVAYRLIKNNSDIVKNY